MIFFSLHLTVNYALNFLWKLGFLLSPSFLRLVHLCLIIRKARREILRGFTDLTDLDVQKRSRRYLVAYSHRDCGSCSCIATNWKGLWQRGVGMHAAIKSKFLYGVHLSRFTVDVRRSKRPSNNRLFVYCTRLIALVKLLYKPISCPFPSFFFFDSNELYYPLTEQRLTVTTSSDSTNTKLSCFELKVFLVIFLSQSSSVIVIVHWADRTHTTRGTRVLIDQASSSVRCNITRRSRVVSFFFLILCPTFSYFLPPNPGRAVVEISFSQIITARISQRATKILTFSLLGLNIRWI